MANDNESVLQTAKRLTREAAAAAFIPLTVVAGIGARSSTADAQQTQQTTTTTTTVVTKTSQPTQAFNADGTPCAPQVQVAQQKPGTPQNGAQQNAAQVQRDAQTTQADVNNTRNATSDLGAVLDGRNVIGNVGAAAGALSKLGGWGKKKAAPAPVQTASVNNNLPPCDVTPHSAGTAPGSVVTNPSTGNATTGSYSNPSIPTAGGSTGTNYNLTAAGPSDLLTTPSGMKADPSMGATAPLPFGDRRTSATDIQPGHASYTLGKMALGKGVFGVSYSSNDPAPDITFAYSLNNGRGNSVVSAEFMGWSKGNHSTAYVRINDDQRVQGTIVGSDGGVYPSGRPTPAGVTSTGSLQKRIMAVQTNGDYSFVASVPVDIVKPSVPDFKPTQTATSQDQKAAWLDAKLKAANTPKQTQTASNTPVQAATSGAGPTPGTNNTGDSKGAVKVIDEGDGKNFVITKPNGDSIEVTRPNPNAKNMYQGQDGTKYIVKPGDPNMVVIPPKAQQSAANR